MPDDLSATISNSNFNTGRDTNLTYSQHQHQHHHGGPVQDPLKPLRKCAALGALYDSAERPDPPRCHPNTRDAIIERIKQWARSQSNDVKPILWLTGAAGAGKSAIAQTLIEWWKSEGIIVPNFFFWRTSTKRNQKTHLIPTLAYQLAKSFPTARTKIEEAIRDEDIFEQNLKSQVEALIINPLKDTLTEAGRLILVVDGVDEVRVNLPKRDGFPGQDYEDQQREILEAMAYACREFPLLRIFIASRPERQLRTSFSRSPLRALSLFVSLIDEPNAEADIALYLDFQFAEIRGQHPGIDPSWPSSAQMALLVEKSSGQFIYPSTVVRYIARGRSFPVKALEEVLALQARLRNGKQHPLAELDALYTMVLQVVDQESWPIVKFLLGLMCYPSIIERERFLRSPLHDLRPTLQPLFLERFLLMSQGELSSHLTDLHSLILIPTPPYTLSHPDIRFMHATLSEFLIDQTRSRDLWITKGEVYLRCSQLFLQRVTPILQCDTPGSSPPEWPIRFDLFKALQSHLSSSSPSKDLQEELWGFLESEIGGYTSEHMVSGLSGTISTGQEGASSSTLVNVPTTLTIAAAKYLLKCNIPEIEPSKSHREIIDRRLKDLVLQMDPARQRPLVNGKGKVSKPEPTRNQTKPANVQGLKSRSRKGVKSSVGRLNVGEKRKIQSQFVIRTLIKIGRWFRGTKERDAR